MAYPERDPRERGQGNPQRYINEDWPQEGSYDYVPPSTSGSFRPPPNSRPPPNRDYGPPEGTSNFTKALIAGAFVMGMGAGVWFDSEVTFRPDNVASTEIVDRQNPSSAVCIANGYTAMVFDQRIFVSFNPFNVYVTQPEVKPGCVLRKANVRELESRGLVDGKEVQACKRNMNTFAFVGDIDKSPEVSCVYHSEDAENQFLVDPRKAALGDGYQPRGSIDQ